ncbi:MAG TPA: Crp/Fnr family transcriptional regulator [Actinomycetota bacterium]|nr:Crp/Fnr family transcriptional regulator [Actinomycetota bacterium]
MAAARTGTRNAGFPLLRDTALSRHLSDEQLAELERFCERVDRGPWATVFRQGQPAERLYVVGAGTVELRARPPGRRLYRTVEVVGPGCTFGDEAVLDDEDYRVAARALEPSSLLALSRSAIQRLSKVRPDVALGVVRCSAGCVIKTMRRAAILTQAPAEVALRQLLSELAAGRARSNGSVPIRITHTQLAGVLHVSRETVSRLLGNLAHAGEVELGRGVIRVRPDAA